MLGWSPSVGTVSFTVAFTPTASVDHESGTMSTRIPRTRHRMASMRVMAAEPAVAIFHRAAPPAARSRAPRCRAGSQSSGPRRASESAPTASQQNAHASPRAARAAQAEIRKGEILGPGEEGSQISTGKVCAQERSAAKTDPAQVERTGICSAGRFARVQCPTKSRHQYSFYCESLRLLVIQRHIAANMFRTSKASSISK